MFYQVHLTWAGFEHTSVVKDTDCIGSCKSNYHTITTMMASKDTSIPARRVLYLSQWFIMAYLTLYCTLVSYIIHRIYIKNSHLQLVYNLLFYLLKLWKIIQCTCIHNIKKNSWKAQLSSITLKKIMFVKYWSHDIYYNSIVKYK